ncbi:hypothetical protein GR160_04560 [Flavobacterium sp. Sd200]|uniref:hypothetical protein n=1 Tax=Flavobacterium sp. Sd200 TaxID=2692211 RepID=UPI0013695108|nr:hypothetical protein [Flavobacterium sp. Sd200]MXN90491.1 hypothetical protein [Flavobacterium sp. Sd200]
MNNKVKSLLYNFLGFAPVFLLVYFLAEKFTGLSGIWIPLAAFVASTILSPKFQVAKFQGEEKIFMRWIFLSGIKEVK